MIIHLKTLTCLEPGFLLFRRAASAWCTQGHHQEERRLQHHLLEPEEATVSLPSGPVHHARRRAVALDPPGLLPSLHY